MMNTGELVAVIIVAIVLVAGTVFICVRCWKALGSLAEDEGKPRRALAVPPEQGFGYTMRQSFRRVGSRLRNSFRRSPRPPPNQAMPQRHVVTIDDLHRERSEIHPAYLKKPSVVNDSDVSKDLRPPTYDEALKHDKLENGSRSPPKDSPSTPSPPDSFTSFDRRVRKVPYQEISPTSIKTWLLEDGVPPPAAAEPTLAASAPVSDQPEAGKFEYYHPELSGITIPPHPSHPPPIPPRQSHPVANSSITQEISYGVQKPQQHKDPWRPPERPLTDPRPHRGHPVVVGSDQSGYEERYVGDINDEGGFAVAIVKKRVLSSVREHPSPPGSPEKSYQSDHDRSFDASTDTVTKQLIGYRDPRTSKKIKSREDTRGGGSWKSFENPSYIASPDNHRRHVSKNPPLHQSHHPVTLSHASGPHSRDDVRVHHAHSHHRPEHFSETQTKHSGEAEQPRHGPPGYYNLEEGRVIFPEYERRYMTTDTYI